MLSPYTSPFISTLIVSLCLIVYLHLLVLFLLLYFHLCSSLVSFDLTDPRARRLGRLLAANIFQLVEEKIPQLYIPPSSTYDQYLRGLRSLPASLRQTGAGSCNTVGLEA